MGLARHNVWLHDLPSQPALRRGAEAGARHLTLSGVEERERECVVVDRRALSLSGRTAWKSGVARSDARISCNATHDGRPGKTLAVIDAQ